MRGMYLRWGLIVEDERHADVYPYLQVHRRGCEHCVVGGGSPRSAPIGMRRPVTGSGLQMKRPLPRNWLVVGLPSRKG